MTLHRTFSTFVLDIIENRHLIITLARRDFEKKFKGSYLGFIWTFLQPLLFIGIIYLIFTAGFKNAAQTASMPFVLYLITGIVAWNYIGENLLQGTEVIKKHAFLVKKVDFRLSVLPIVNLLSTIPTHLVFALIAITLAWHQGFAPSMFTFQLVYYFFCMAILVLAINWMTASSALFVPDVSNAVGLLVQFGFWLTPIFWSIDIIPARYRWLVDCNPAYYIISGYRDALVQQRWFWERPYETLLFWSMTLILLVLSVYVFKRLRPHFAEVV